jgi:hypothetical protein
MTNEELQMMVALGAIPEEQAMLMAQREQGEGMMSAPTPQGRQVGQAYVASSPLEHMGAALQRALGARQMRQAERGYGDTLQRQTQGRVVAERQRQAQEQQGGAQLQALIDAMNRRFAAPQQPAAQPAAQQQPGPWAGGYEFGG